MEPIIVDPSNNEGNEPITTDAEARKAEEGQGFKVRDRRFWNLDEKELEAEENAPKLPSYVEQLQAQVEEKDKQLKDYIAAYKKEVGENLEKTKQRLERDAALKMEALRGELASPMLDVLETLERTLTAVQTQPNLEALVEGVKMVHLLMTQKLGEFGLERIEAVGAAFDPALHEGVAVVPASDVHPTNTIVAEFRPGFKLGGRVLRPAVVQVAK